MGQIIDDSGQAGWVSDVDHFPRDALFTESASSNFRNIRSSKPLFDLLSIVLGQLLPPSTKRKGRDPPGPWY
jgi:hypothetical protein